MTIPWHGFLHGCYLTVTELSKNDQERSNNSHLTITPNGQKLSLYGHGNVHKAIDQLEDI